MARRRSKNANAAAKAQEEARKTSGRNRLVLNMMGHRFNTSKAMNALAVDASVIKERHALESAALAQRHAIERATLQKQQDIEKKSHAVKATRTKKMHNTHSTMLGKTLKQVMNA